MTAAAMLSRESRRWGDRDDNDGEEEVVEVDDNDETTTTSAPPPPATTNPSPPRRIHPHRGGGRCVDNDYNDVMVLDRWRLDVGNAYADGADAMAGCGDR